jgi:abhydrolase domain-containing protein 6
VSKTVKAASSKKPLPLLPALTALVATGGLAVLAVQVYRHPRETVNSIMRAGMLLSGARETTYDIDGIPLHYYYAGRRGTPIVLIHGLGSSAEVWAAVMAQLSNQFLVYALDMPGHGKTPLAPEGTSIQANAYYLKRFLDELGYPHVTLVGNSLGGWIATRFAVDFPERVRHLYLLNSAGLIRENFNSPYATDRATARRAIENIVGYSLPLPGFLLDAVVRTSQMPSYAGFIQNYDAQEELDPVLAQVQAPTTIIWGVRDGLFPIACANDFHSGIANSDLILLQRVGHVPQMQAPVRVARIIAKREQERPR